MTTEQIHTTLDKMLEDPKAKTFLNHLVRSYMPVSQIEKVWDKPEGIFKCVISRDELISTQEILEGIHTEEFKTNMMTSLKGMFDDNVDKTSPMVKLMADKKMGVTGKGTTTFMSYPVAQEFYNWIITKSLKGDKHINWLLGSIRRASFIERGGTIQDKEVQAKIVKLTKTTKSTATFTLGDSNDGLMKLKALMEANEKK
jgi:hypothetical protein